MSNVQFKLNKAGVRELLKSDGVYPERSGAVIAATTMRAVNDNKKNNTLLKAVGG